MTEQKGHTIDKYNNQNIGIGTTNSKAIKTICAPTKQRSGSKGASSQNAVIWDSKHYGISLFVETVRRFSDSSHFEYFFWLHSLYIILVSSHWGDLHCQWEYCNYNGIFSISNTEKFLSYIGYSYWHDWKWQNLWDLLQICPDTNFSAELF